VKKERRRRGTAEKAWMAGCPLKVPKGQFPVKYTRTVPRRDAWAVSGCEIDIKAERVYGGKYRNILFQRYILPENCRHFIGILCPIKIPADLRNLESAWLVDF